MCYDEQGRGRLGWRVGSKSMHDLMQVSTEASELVLRIDNEAENLLCNSSAISRNAIGINHECNRLRCRQLFFKLVTYSGMTRNVD